MNTIKREQIWESLQDPDFRKQLIDEHVNVGIAFQIHGLRERQGLNQKQLAERLGDKKKQPLISAWENPNYGKYTLGTLKDLAKAFDVGLLVRFVPFNTLVDWTINLTRDVIAPPSFNEERIIVTTEIGITPLNKGVPQSIVSFINSIPSTPSTFSASTIYMEQGKEMIPNMEKGKEMSHAAAGNI